MPSPSSSRPSSTPPPKPEAAPRQIALREVAAAAAVSRMTVSLALRNHPALPLATRSRIQKIAAELGYQPDPALNQVMGHIRARRRIHKAITIGWVTAHVERDAWREHPTQLSYHQGAWRRAESLGYRLEEFWLRAPGMTDRRLSEVIRNRGIDGVIVSPLPQFEPIFQDFRWDYFSVVATGYSLETPELCRACNHQFQSIQLLVGELHGRGYRRIGFAMEADQDNRVRHNWRGGFLSSPAFFPKRPAVPLLLHADWTRERFSRWLKRHRPDVVVTAGPEVERWLGELGLRTPHDIGLANIDLTPTMKGVTGINQNSPQVGAAAVELLISLINSHQRGIPAIPQIFMVQGDYVQGRTTRARLRPLRSPA